MTSTFADWSKPTFNHTAHEAVFYGSRFMKPRTTQVTLAPPGEPIFSERAYTISIDDHGAGEFVTVSSNAVSSGALAIDKTEWPALRDAIDFMVEECMD